MCLLEVVKQLGCSIGPWAGVEWGIPVEWGCSWLNPGGEGLGVSPCLPWSGILAPVLPYPGADALAVCLGLGGGGIYGPLQVTWAGG